MINEEILLKIVYVETMKKETYQKVIRQALEIIKSNLSVGLTIPELAKRVGYSQSRLGVIFQKATGRNVVEHVVDIRLEEAERLLGQTDLNIIEIALETGFGSHEHFTRSFRNRTGMTPTQFRNVKRAGGLVTSAGQRERSVNAREYLRQDFAGEDFSKTFEVKEGSLRQEDGYAAGYDAGSFHISLLRPLPENVEICLDLRLLSKENGGPSHAILSLFDESAPDIWYYGIVLGAFNFDACLLKQQGINRRIIMNPPLKPDQWQTLRVQIVDDRTSAFLDGVTLFEFRDDFPPSYSQRCRLLFGSWQSAVHFRRLRIRDLGSPATTRTIRQGDAFYNAKAFDAARGFYGRLLEMQTVPEESAELYYKIGMCFFSQNAFSQARTWLDGAILHGGDLFWMQQTKLGLMRLDILEQKAEGITSARHLMANPGMRDEARIALESASHGLLNTGDFARNLLLWKLMLEQYDKGGVLYCEALKSIAETQEWLLQIEESERNLNEVIESASTPRETRANALREIEYVYRMQGKFAKSEESLNLLLEMATTPALVADCEVLKALLLRAQNKPQQALADLENVAVRSNIPDRCAWAKFEASLILCGLGKPEQAREAIKDAKRLCPSITYLRPGWASHHAFVPELVSGNFEQAAELLLVDSRAQDTMVFSHGQQAMAAGLIMELTGDKKKSRRVWVEMLRRFPLQRCAHLAPVAEAWLRGEMPELTQLPLGNQRLSEMLYLAARACEVNGNHVQSKTLLERCVQLDPSLRWPACLAKKWLAESHAE